MRIRQEQNFRHDALTLFEDVNVDTYDRVGKRGGDAKGVLATTGEKGEFFFTDSGSEGDVVGIVYLGGVGGQIQLKLSGTGSKGSHLAIGANGVIVASDTDSGAELTTSEIGVALADWTDGESVECDIYKI